MGKPMCKNCASECLFELEGLRIDINREKKENE